MVPRLDDPALAHHRHPVGDGEGLLLVVRHQDRRRPGLAQDVVQVGREPLAQPPVEGAQRFVEEQQPGTHGECPGQGDPLALAPGQRGGHPVGVPREARPARAAPARAPCVRPGWGAWTDAAPAGRRRCERRRGARRAGRPGTSGRTRAGASGRRPGRGRRTRSVRRRDPPGRPRRAAAWTSRSRTDRGPRPPSRPARRGRRARPRSSPRSGRSGRGSPARWLSSSGG